MHFVMTYDLRLPAGEERQRIESEILSVLAQYRYVHHLSTLYIVHVTGVNDWELIRQALTRVATQLTDHLSFIMSPPMTGGRYNGILPEEAWREINEITNMDV